MITPIYEKSRNEKRSDMKLITIPELMKNKEFLMSYMKKNDFNL